MMLGSLIPSDLLFDKFSFETSLQITSSPHMMSILPNTCFEITRLPPPCDTDKEFFISEMKITKAINNFPKLIGVSTNVLVDNSYNLEEISESILPESAAKKDQKTQRAINALSARRKYPFVIHPNTEITEDHHIIRSFEGQYSPEFIKAVGLIEKESDILNGLIFGELQNSARIHNANKEDASMDDFATTFTIRPIDSPYSFIVSNGVPRVGLTGEQEDMTSLIIVKEASDAFDQHAFINYLRDTRAIQCRDEEVLGLYGLDPLSDAYMVFSTSIFYRHLHYFYKNVVGQVKPWKFLTPAPPINGINLFSPSIPVTAKSISIAIADATKGGQWTWKSPIIPPDEDKTEYTIKIDMSITGFTRKETVPKSPIVFPRLLTQKTPSSQ
jgi:hypothetical protein